VVSISRANNPVSCRVEYEYEKGENPLRANLIIDGIIDQVIREEELTDQRITIKIERWT